MARRGATLITTALLALALAGCASAPEPPTRAEPEQDGGFDLRKLVGTVKNPPDEFGVLRKRPLEMPQDFAALPPPRPGAKSSRDPDPIAEARAVLLDQPTPTVAADPSAAERALISAAGPADPNVRALAAEEQAAYEQEQDLYVLDRVMPWLRELRGETAREVIDPAAERQRLQETRAARAPDAAPAEIPGEAAGPAAIARPAVAAPASETGAAATDGAISESGLIYIPE